MSVSGHHPYRYLDVPVNQYTIGHVTLAAITGITIQVPYLEVKPRGLIWKLDKMAATLADDIFKCIFSYENDWILIPIPLKLVPKSPGDNKPALVQVMALASNRRQVITWTNDDPALWRIYAALGGDELRALSLPVLTT